MHMTIFQRDSIVDENGTLRRSIRIYAKGYCQAAVDLQHNTDYGDIEAAIFVHIERTLMNLSEQFGYRWTDEEVASVRTDIRRICMNHYKPF